MTTATAEIPVQRRPAGVEWRRSPAVETSSPLPDHDLMLAVRDGDLDCMGELFERHHGPLFGYLSKLTCNRTAAEDIVQNVFQRMLKYRHTYRDEGSFTAWMYHLARRCATDHYRKSSAAPISVDSSHLEAHADESQSADESASVRDDHALLHRALGRLDRDDREVLLLSRLQELSFAEVATILECSVGAARVRAHRALKTLRDHYLQLQKEPQS
jgi:RNA polymerase sigma factor (sigma-70 family)